MRIKPDCLVCIMHQTLKSAKLLGVDDVTAKKMLDSTAEILQRSDLSMTPPQIAKDTYAQIARIVHKDDPIEAAKRQAVETAEKLLDFQPASLDEAVRLAVAGNVIDFGAQQTFSLEHMLCDVLEKPFAHSDIQSFLHDLSHAKTMVYIGDNVGEHLFDKVLIETIKRKYAIDVYYFVRGRPIINDVTVKEAEVLQPIATVVDTGVPTPGYDLGYANDESLRLFDQADIVLSKGMGNFESLYGITSKSVYYLFVVKCSVVSDAIGYPEGSFLLIKHPHNP